MDFKSISIDQSKISADGDAYFALFDKHILRNLGNGSTVLLYELANMTCIMKIIALNPDAKYIVIGNKFVNDALKLMVDKHIDVEYKEEIDLKERDMKFDCIVMNPPYQRNLHLKILAEAIKHLKDDGTCVNLSPVVWLANYNINRPMSKYRKTFNSKLKQLEIIDHATANELFGTGNSIEELGIYVLKNDNSRSLDLENYGFKTDAEKALYDKISKKSIKDCLTFSQCIAIGKGSQGGVVKEHEVNVYTWHGGKNCHDAVVRYNDKKRSFVLYFNNDIERQNFLNSLDTTFMNWYWRMFVVPGDNKVRNYMFIMSDYSQPWDDARFYKFFNITPEEQKTIEETMAKYDHK